MGAALPLPTRRDEEFRYSDLDALARIWDDDAQIIEQINVPAGGKDARQIILPLAKNGVSVTNYHIHIGAGGTFALHIILAHADYARAKIMVTLDDGAHFEMGGAILAKDSQNIEIVTHIIHAQPNATSNQVVRKILAGRSTGSFLGKIDVARHAQKTDAAQSVKAMLLDRGATANAKPELEIFADDVKCAHGATVGELDKMGLFYLASRGIPPILAKKLMLQAFMGDVFAEMDAAKRDDATATAIAILDDLL
ncbi:Fe-S cluster assembly protein SufD [Sphingorhabdus lutea]|uniref:Fe-S cluster assembly protein SufD n=1 Tax=Sphingorhabdus lutea TaxID=1913578 RepID=A0A1L3J9K7_9SPHN|nr:SufD family Fe-S cluster assembly protein [Sphingorhabdus lutea]APG61816.1 Fe-S cluster assembly protein SufD [Sphingorhabdus lutea]